MYKVKIKKLPKQLDVIFENKEIILPIKYQKQINDYWNSIIKENKNFIRGKVYAISKIVSKKGGLEIYLQLTDYAHYLYTINHNIQNKHACRVAFAVALIQTIDKKLVFGEMATNTSTPSRLQCVGGGIEKDDIEGDRVNLNRSISKELFEEVGIHLNDKSIVSSIEPKFIKSGGEKDFIAVIFVITLLINFDELQNIFKKHRDGFLRNGKIPELNSLIAINEDSNSITSFVKYDQRPRVDYLIPVLKLMIKNK